MDPTTQSLNSSVSTSTSTTSGFGSSLELPRDSISTIGTLIGSMDLTTFAGNNNISGDTLKAGNGQDDLFSSEYDANSLYDQVSVTMSSMSINTSTTSISTVTANSVQQQNINKQLLQRVILSSITNVNLVHEILRNVSFNASREIFEGSFCKCIANFK